MQRFFKFIKVKIWGQRTVAFWFICWVISFSLFALTLYCMILPNYEMSASVIIIFLIVTILTPKRLYELMKEVVEKIKQARFFRTPFFDILADEERLKKIEDKVEEVAKKTDARIDPKAFSSKIVSIVANIELFKARILALTGDELKVVALFYKENRAMTESEVRKKLVPWTSLLSYAITYGQILSHFKENGILIPTLGLGGYKLSVSARVTIDRSPEIKERIEMLE